MINFSKNHVSSVHHSQMIINDESKSCPICLYEVF